MFVDKNKKEIIKNALSLPLTMCTVFGMMCKYALNGEDYCMLPNNKCDELKEINSTKQLNKHHNQQSIPINCYGKEKCEDTICRWNYACQQIYTNLDTKGI